MNQVDLCSFFLLGLIGIFSSCYARLHRDDYSDNPPSAERYPYNSYWGGYYWLYCYPDPCYGCYYGPYGVCDCHCCACGNCGNCNCDHHHGNCDSNVVAVLLIIVAVVVIIIILVGLFFGIFLTTVLASKIAHRHIHVLRKSQQVHVYYVANLADPKERELAERQSAEIASNESHENIINDGIGENKSLLAKHLEV